MSRPEITFRSLGITIAYRSVLFPFDPLPFVSALPKAGFRLSQALAQPGLGARIEMAGPVGQKEDVLLGIDTERKTIALRAANTEALLRELDSIETLIDKVAGLDRDRWTDYYEFVAELNVQGAKNPLESWGRQLGGAQIFRAVEKTLGIPVLPFGMRVARRGALPIEADWLDLRIEPLVQAADRRHHVHVVLRSPKRAEVVALVERFEDIVGTLIESVEAE